MKRLNTMLNIMVVGAVVCATALPALAATPVKNVTLAKSGNFTEVTVPVPSHQLCDHFTESATANKPFRIVLNICDAEHALAQQNFNSLPPCMVQKIRTSQFETSPQQIVRVVLDLKSSATYTVRTESDRLVVAIADPSPVFAVWQASSQPVMASSDSPVQANPPSMTQSPQTVKPAPVVKADSPVMSSVTPSETKPKSEVGAKIVPPSAAASEQVPARPSQSLVMESVNGTPMTADELVGPGAKKQTTESDPSMTVSAPKQNFKLPSQPLVLSPEYLDAGEAVMNKMEAPIVSMTPDQPKTMPAFDGTTPRMQADPNNPPMLAVGNDPSGVMALPPTLSSNAQPTTQEALIDKLKSKFFSEGRAPKPYLTEQGLLLEQLKGMDSAGTFGPPTPGSNLDREALLERIRQASRESNSRLPGNTLPSLPGGPVRAEVFYDDLGRRDPFEALLKGLRSGFLSDELPNVEALRMVGVLKDSDQALALMEDTEGHSYIMRAGDPVNNGRVLSVGEARTIIQVDEYGWTRTVVLQLSPRGADPSKSLGARTARTQGEEATPAQGE